jgi:hypothetical protein
MHNYYDLRKLDQNYMEKYGHGFYKEYENGDENRYVFPERDTLSGNGIYLYHKYKICSTFGSKEKNELKYRGYDPNKKYVWMSFCPCNHFGQICENCKNLNTTEFLGLSVPLCKEDFTELQNYLKDHYGLNDSLMLYEWLEFWINEYTKYRTIYGERKLVFWNYSNFKYGSIYTRSIFQFFRFIFEYIVKKKYPNYEKYDKILYRKISEGIVEIRSCIVLLEFTINIYKKGNIINSIVTNKKWSKILYKEHDIIETQIKITLKKIQSLIKKYPKIQELDINPLFINDKASTIADARIVFS